MLGGFQSPTGLQELHYFVYRSQKVLLVLKMKVFNAVLT